MPLLSWREPLPWRPSRVLVAGTSGAGKTSLATLLAEAWQLPRVELDALHHGENWVPRPSFAAWPSGHGGAVARSSPGAAVGVPGLALRAPGGRRASGGSLQR